MANLTETPIWETGIYQLELNDPVDAGTGGNGVSNLQAKQLANRTSYLKNQVDGLGTQNTTQANQIQALEDTQIIGYGGRKFRDIIVVTANLTLNQIAHAGTLIRVTTSGVDITVPPLINQGSYSGGTYAVVNDSGGNIRFLTGGTGNNIIPSGSLILENGDFAEVAANAGNLFLVGLRRANDLIPSGTVMAFAASSPPSGWLVCNGAAISQTTYNVLYSVIGTTFNYTNPGVGNFRVPDLRAEFIRGFDNGRGVDSGRVFGSTQGDDIKAHNHTLNKYDLQIGTGSTFFAPDPAGDDGTLTTSNTGGTETRPRNVALLYCIKY